MTSPVEAVARRAPVEPLPSNLTSTQPGGGFCYRAELAWGRWRRWYLRRFRPAYVRRMAALRVGDTAGAPHPIVDPRDLKYCRNQCDCRWPAEADPFRRRAQLPFARWGLAELQLLGWPLLALVLLTAVGPYWYLAALPAIMLGLVAWFFRDPARRVPEGAGLWVSPADGRVAEVVHLDDEPFLGGPAVRIGIFLSIFNVHVNRVPSRCRVLALKYSPGEFRNALDPASALVNENIWIGCEEEEPPHRRFVVRQIAGAIARRIVCDLRPGEVLARGEKFGMIKLGSRTELWLLAEEGLSIEVEVGDRVHGGSTVLARYGNTNA